MRTHKNIHPGEILREEFLASWASQLIVEHIINFCNFSSAAAGQAQWK